MSRCIKVHQDNIHTYDLVNYAVVFFLLKCVQDLIKCVLNLIKGEHNLLKKYVFVNRKVYSERKKSFCVYFWSVCKSVSHVSVVHFIYDCLAITSKMSL